MSMFLYTTLSAEINSAARLALESRCKLKTETAPISLATAKILTSK
jgi:hypothetical protein